MKSLKTTDKVLLLFIPLFSMVLLSADVTLIDDISGTKYTTEEIFMVRFVRLTRRCIISYQTDNAVSKHSTCVTCRL